MGSRSTVKNILVMTVLVAALLTSTASHSQEIKEVISTSPSWNTFTNRDGTGLYHEILDAVFAQYGITVRHIYSKSIRSEEMVLKGEADMMTCDDAASPPLKLARYPMYTNDFYVFFKKGRMKWKGEESLRGETVLAQPTYYAASNFPVPVTIKEVQTGAQALALIMMDRYTFYVDDMTLIRQSMKENDLTFNKELYDIQKVGSRSYHPLFSNTKRGQEIMELYDSGVVKLHKAGKLKPIFDKWGYQYPDYSRY